MDFYNTAWKILSSPNKFFKQEKIKPSVNIRYYFSVLFIAFFLVNILRLLVFPEALSSLSTYANLFNSLGLNIGLTLGSGVLFLLIDSLLLIPFLAVALIWIHLWIAILGGKGKIKDTFKAAIYSFTPYTPLVILIFLATQINQYLALVLILILLIWMFVLFILGLNKMHNISHGKVLLSFALAFLAIVTVITILRIFTEVLFASNIKTD